MTDIEYLEKMFHLTTKLTDACNNYGLRSDEYNAVLKEIAARAARFNRSRGFSGWGKWVILVLFGLLILVFMLMVLSLY